MAQLVTTDTLDSALFTMLMGTNRIINGGMEVAQRGSVALTSGAGAYTLDRWRVANSDAGCSGTVSQVASSNFGSGYALNILTTQTGGINYITQRVESVVARALYGDTGRFSARVQHDTGSALNFYLDVYTANAVDNFGALTLLGSSAAISVPSGTPTTLSLDLSFGTGAVVNGLLVQVRHDAVTLAAKNIMVGEAILTEAGVATQRRLRMVEELLCQRYYQRGIPLGARGFSGGVGQSVGSPYTLRTTMRAAPTVTLVPSLQSSVGTVSFHAQSASGGCCTFPSSATGDFYWFGSVTADSEL